MYVKSQLSFSKSLRKEVCGVEGVRCLSTRSSEKRLGLPARRGAVEYTGGLYFTFHYNDGDRRVKRRFPKLRKSRVSGSGVY